MFLGYPLPPLSKKMPLERRQESADLNYPPFEIESVVLDTLEPISSPQEVLEIRDVRIFPTFSSLKVAEGIPVYSLSL